MISHGGGGKRFCHVKVFIGFLTVPLACRLEMNEKQKLYVKAYRQRPDVKAAAILEGQTSTISLPEERAPCRLGATPLHRAALKGHQEVVDYLMSKGATFEATGTLAKVCKCCGADDASLKCALCLTVYYCCKGCQVRDWKEGGENKESD